MIENIEVSGVKYKVEETLRKYTVKRLGHLDKFLPKKNRKDVVMRVVVKQVNRPHGNKYEISVAVDVPGGKMMTARDEAGNVFAGVDILEAKLRGQVRKFKADKIEHEKKGILKKLLKR
ncbi:ribosome-associated translation inhibitor RaiA [Candidatus Saccharibacteria bacterium]|nr:ribosome-associated translation inhibitor RaiA [Candidatus Saccharibacteria bacterium]